MGWTYTNRPKGQSGLEFFRQEFGEDVLAVKSVGFSQAYIAYKLKTGEIIAVACLTNWVPNDYFNFGYKDMSEDMGPNIANCPRSILNLLTTPPPFTGDGLKWAAAWRARCEANLQKADKLKGLQVGDVLVFDQPVHFGGGARISAFRIEEWGRRKTFSDASWPSNGNGYYRLRRDTLRGGDFTVSSAAEWEAQQKAAA